MKKLLLITSTLFILQASTPLSGTEEIMNLKGKWKGAGGDAIYFSKQNYDHSRWRTISVPASFSPFIQLGQDFWLRKNFQLDSTPATNLALVISSIFDNAEIYINGKLSCKTDNALFIPRINGQFLVCPLPPDVTEGSQAVIAFRGKSYQTKKSGIVKDDPIILSLKEAVEMRFSLELKGIVYSLLFFAISLIFLIHSLRLADVKLKKESAIFAAFQFLIGLLYLSSNTTLSDLNLPGITYGITHLIALSLLPPLFLHYNMQFSDKNASRIFYLIAILPVIYTSIAIIINRPTIRVFIPETYLGFSFILSGISSWTLYNDYKKNKNNRMLATAVGNFSLLLFLLYIFLHHYNFLTGRADILFPSLVISLFFAGGILQNSLKLYLEERRNRNERVQHINVREKIFEYLNQLVHKPTIALVETGFRLLEEKKERAKLSDEMIDICDQNLEKLTSIIELNQLELERQTSATENVQFKEFIEDILAKEKYSAHINLNSRISVLLNRELFKTFISRLLKFEGFQEFIPKEIIVTTDAQNNIHLKLFIFHPNPNETRLLLEKITTENPDENNLWIKWKIIEEYIRILGGTSTLKLLHRKFLRLDIRFRSNSTAESENFTESNDEFRISRRFENENQFVIAEHNEKTDRKKPKEILTPFSVNMTPGDLVKAIKERVQKK